MEGSLSIYFYADMCDFTDSRDTDTGCKHGYKQCFYARTLTLVYDVGRTTGVAPAGERSAGWTRL